MSGRRALILAAARRVGNEWEETGGVVTPALQAALNDLAALTGTYDHPEPNDTTYLVLREDWGNWIVQAATDGEAREKYVKEVPHLGFRGIFRDTRIPLWSPREDDGEEEP